MAESAFILIVEDASGHADALTEGLRKEGHLCRVVAGGDEAIESIRARRPDVIAANHDLIETDSDNNFLAESRRLAPDAEIVVLVPDGRLAEVRKKLGTDRQVHAFEFIATPAAPEKICDIVSRAAKAAQHNRQQRALQEQVDRRVKFEGIITINEKMIRALHKLRKAAESKLTVFILGETGTGKELAARAVFRNSPRSDKPYRAINCAGLNENLLESELFGHVKGAFTGAISDRKGLLDVVDGGTLFLDEVGDMPLPIQAKLLRTLEAGEILPVGSNDIRKVDVRIVAATRQDVREMVDSGEFRDDLFYRLNQATIRIPPLRERREDIPLLIDHFVKEACKSHGKQVSSIAPDVVRKLTGCQWPGNVRELRSVIDAMVVYAESPQLEMDDLPEHIRGSTDLAVATIPSTAGLTMEQMEKLHIANTLKLTGGNREKTAKLLGIGARTLYRKLREYNL